MINDHEGFVLDTINTALQKVGLSRLRHVNDTTNGGEWHGQCIKCARESGNGGDDRFRVNPNRPIEDESGMRQDPIFTCRQCSREDKPSASWSGDLVAFVRYAYRLGYREARAFLNLPPKKEIERVMGYTNRDTGTPQHAPSQTWQNRAIEFMNASQARLWHSQEGEVALRYLQEDRKLPEKIILDAQLGYHYPNTIEEGKLWGLEGLTPLPCGIVIPSWFGTNIMGVSIRLPKYYVERNYLKTGIKSKYNVVRGSVSTLYSTRWRWLGEYTSGYPLVICEGQFDALSLIQSGYPTAVVSTNGVTGAQAELYIQLIKNIGFDPILTAFDTDEAGQKATRFWLSAINTSDSLLVAYPAMLLASDVNDMLVSGVDIRTWLEGEFARIYHMRSMIKSFSIPRMNAVIVVPAAETAQISIVEPSSPIQDEIEDTMQENNEVVPLQNVEIVSVEVVETPPVESWKVHDVQPVQLDYVRVLGDYSSLYAEVRGIEEEYIGKPITPLCLDLETTGLDPRKDKIISLSYGTVQDVCVIDLRPAYENAEQFEAYKELLHRLFAGYAGTLWIGHNIKFDMNFLHAQFDIKLEYVYDTMIAERILYAGVKDYRFNLLESAERYNLAVSKEERSWFIDLHKRYDEWDAPFPIEQINYMAQDIEIPCQIWERQYEKLSESNLFDILDLENKALPAFSAMEVAGVAIDVERWKAIIENVMQKQAELESQLQEILGKAYLEYRETLPIALTKTGKPRKVKEVTQINLGSHLQLKQAYEWLGIHLESTDKDALVEQKNEHESIPLLLKWKGYQKFLTSFGEKLLAMVGEDQRIHATFEQLGTVTGRVSCHSPNLQQIPKAPKNADEELDIRACFVAQQGCKLAVADLSNIELRILADQSGDTTMLDMFARGLDLHSTTARRMFNLSDDIDPDEHLINGKPARFIAKTINFGLAYGLQAPGLARRVDVSEEQAQEFINTYFKMFPGVKRYLDRLATQALNRGYSMTVMGRRRYYAGTREQRFSNHFRGEIERAAKNHPIQGTNADILKISLAMLFKELPENCRLVLTVHDEIVIEFPESLQEQVVSTMARCMESACKQLLQVVTIPEQKVVVSDHWTK